MSCPPAIGSLPEDRRGRALLLALSALLAVGLAGPPAGAQIVLPGTQPGDIQNWNLLPPTFCQTCHGQFELETDHEPWETWAGSMMANAARDPLYWAAVDIANQDAPGIGEFCIRCHSPRAWLEGRSSAPDGSAFIGSPAFEGGDFEGVDCHVCHRMYEGPENSPYFENGQYWVDDGAPGQQPPFRGPYTDAQAPHPWIFSAYHRSSDMCAVCHNLSNPLVNLLDENGKDTGLAFPEQVTYDEWAQSSFPEDGVECQTCHMPSVVGRACFLIEEPRDDLPLHELSGANTWIPQVLKGEFGASLNREPHFERAINLALDMLQNQSAELTMDVPSRGVPGTDLVVRTKVTNLTGHKLPTGYPEGRRMWLQVLVQDALGATVYESGAYDIASATLAQGPDLQVWETIHGVHGEGASFHLVRNNRIFTDNRIPPAGFVPDAKTMPVGHVFETLPDGSLANWDRVEHAVPLPADAVGPLTVTASLWYQTSSRAYVEFLRDENTSGPDPHDPDYPNAPSRGEKIHSFWENYGKSAPVLMRSAQRQVTLDRPVPVSVVAVPSIVRLVGPTENPFRESTRIAWEMPSQSSVRLSVFDVQGRRVRTLAEGDFGPGAHDAAWDGRDDRGRPAASGSYFLRLEIPGHAPRVSRVVMLR